MQIDFLSVLITVFSLVILLLPGYFFAKTKLFGENADKTISNLVLYCAQPALVFMSFQKSYSPQIALNMLYVAGLATVIHVIMFVIVYAFIRQGKSGKTPSKKIDVVRFASVFSNCGYMGIPFLKMLFSDSPALGEMLIYVAVVMGIFNIFNWTVGIFMYSHDKKDISLKKIILAPPVIALILGFIYFILAKQPLTEIANGINGLDLLLEKVSASIDLIGNMVTPLSMFVIGMKLSKLSFKQLLLDKWAYVSSFNKLIVMSLVSILVVGFLPIAIEIKYSVFFALSMPSASSTTLFAVSFGGDGDSASVMVLLSTILSVLTVSLMFLLFNVVVGV